MPTIQPRVIHGSKMTNQLLFDTCKKRIKAHDTLGLALHERVPCTRAQFTLSYFNL